MANVRILDRAGRKVRVAFYIPVPAGTNKAGVAYSDALTVLDGPGLSRLPVGDGLNGTIAREEADAIAANTLIERLETIELQGDWDEIAQAKKRFDILDEFFAAKKDEFQKEIVRRLAWFGMTR